MFYLYGCIEAVIRDSDKLGPLVGPTGTANAGLKLQLNCGFTSGMPVGSIQLVLRYSPHALLEQQRHLPSDMGPEALIGRVA